MPINWGSYDPATATAESKAAESAGAGDWVQWKDGENVGRVVPQGPNDASTFDIVEQHQFTPPGAQYPFRFVCPGPGCRACAMVAQLEATGNPADREAAYELRANGRVYFRWIDRDNEDRGVLKAAVSLKLFAKMNEIRQDRRRGGDFVHPINGFDLCIMRKPPGSPGNKTKFPAYDVVKDQVRALGTDEQMRFWLETLPPLKALAPYKELSEVERMLTGGRSESRGELRGRTVQADAESDEERDFLT